MGYLFKNNTITVNCDEVDFINRLKPSAILQYFQDVVEIHAVDLNMTYEQMAEKNKFWILSRMSVIIDEYPSRREQITVTTYPRKPKMVQGIRDFYITNQNQKTLIRATSRWCVLDILTKKICKCGEFFPFADECFKPENAIKDALNTLPQIAVTDKIARSETFKVGNSDLDYNFHMNNAKYGDVIFNVCDFGQLNDNKIKAFDIYYISELKAGDVFIVQRADYNGFSLIEAKKAHSASVVFRAKIDWIPVI